VDQLRSVVEDVEGVFDGGAAWRLRNQTCAVPDTSFVPGSNVCPNLVERMTSAAMAVERAADHGLAVARSVDVGGIERADT
jgi:hypothetical protein